MNQTYINTISQSIADATGKLLTFDTKNTPEQVEGGFDAAILALQNAKAAYVANPSAAVVSTIESVADDLLKGIEAALDGEGQTTWGGYLGDADALLNYVTTHPAITKLVGSIATMFKKKAVAATPTGGAKV